MPAGAEQIRTTLDEYFTRFSAGDRDGWVALFTDDAEQEDPVGSPLNVGHEAIAAFYDGVLAMLGPPTLSFKEEPIIVGDEAVAIFQVVAGEGASRVRIPTIVDHFRFADDGRIRGLPAFWDASTLAPFPE
jgi:steroid delta-isomerase